LRNVPKLSSRLKMRREFDVARVERQRDGPLGINHSALRPFLDRLLRRSRLCADEQSAILELGGRLSTVSINHDIVSPGTTVDRCSLVVEGVVGRFDQITNGRRQITALHLPGDMCDLNSTVWPESRSGLEALTDCTIFLIPLEGLRILGAAFPAIALAFWLDTAADASICAKWVTKLGRGEANERLAHLLCELGMRMEKAGLATRKVFPMLITQAQLANALGLSPFYLNRTMRALQKGGIIEKGDKTMIISDWERLAAIAGFDPGFLLIPPEDRCRVGSEVHMQRSYGNT
jgi:CRP-like cAMP-binding protein